MSPASAADSQHASVAVVGGGLAGLSAGCALAEAGYHVTLFERRPFVGGRASSYEHPGTGEVVDNCQHVLLGCCTNLLDLYDRLGAREKISWYDRLTFIEPGGRRSEIGPSFLPAPLHTTFSFLGAKSLSLRDKLGISRAMMSWLTAIPAESDEDFLTWLRRHGQTERAIDRFWKMVLVSALNEDLNKMSVHYAAQVFRESFLKSAEAGRMGVPTVPLTELYGAAIEYIRARGGDVLVRTAVERVAPADSVTITTAAGEQRFDFAILAVPYTAIARMLPSDSTGQQLAQAAQHFESSPITGIHLWFDRQITELDHAVLLDRTIQWMFHKSRLLARHRNVVTAERSEQGSYVELVVSASKSLVEMSRQQVIDLALRELADFFPAVREAKLLKAAVIKEIHATYSAQPGQDRFRPQPQTAWPRVMLAGDWTATGWPATMEGAVRSGYRAAEVLSAAAQHPQEFMKPDLAPAGLMKLFPR